MSHHNREVVLVHPGLSPCEKELGSQKYKRFGKIVKCAQIRNCLDDGVNSVYCKSCKISDRSLKFGAYRYPSHFFSLVRQEIYLCEEYFGRISANHDEAFLEEAYHAVTVCPRGQSATIGLDSGLDYVRELVKRDQIAEQTAECIRCIARELLAKHCSLLATGKRNNIQHQNDHKYLMDLINAKSSCSDYCMDDTNLAFDQLLATDEAKYSRVFYEKLDYYCAKVDEECEID